MGFRSTITTFDYRAIAWPQWFRERYEGILNVPERGAISSSREFKTYSDLGLQIDRDIQAAIDWESVKLSFVVVYLHECGGITRVEITKDKITYTEPSAWVIEPEPTHAVNSCYGCSDVETTATAAGQA